MGYDWITEQISDDLPCGPNLEQQDDDGFLDYYFEAESRLPERYFTPGMVQDESTGRRTPDRLFDPASIDIKAEQKEVEALLRRSRDLRLLSLMARFEILAGRLGGFADALEAIDAVLRKWPAQVHPDLATAPNDRRDALRALCEPVTVLSPLAHLSLTGAPEVTLRAYQVASGQATKRHDETEIDVAGYMRMVSDEGMKRQVARTQTDLTRAAAALTGISQTCKADATKPISVDFSEVLARIAEIQAVISSARPELAAKPPAPPEVVAQESEETAPGPTVPEGPAPTALPDFPTALATLGATEAFLLTREPSSAALLLVAQARKLVGKPLIEALETLLPEDSKRAVVDLGPQTGFILSMDRLKSLSGELVAQRSDPAEPAGQAPQIKNRAELAGHIRAVEDFYRRNEPSSPIPLLLERARTYLDKDFQSLVSELVPAKGNVEN